MRNYGLGRFKTADVDNFTSDIGIELRKIINPVLRPILKVLTKGNIKVVNYPKLEKGKNYIFVSTHNFVEDCITNLSTIDRNAYVLFGTTDQIDVNPEVYAAWLNGFIYVNRDDEKSRKDALLKMKRILDAKSSVLIYAEGSFNNTENLLVQRLFSSPYILSKQCNVEVVPIAPYHEVGAKDIYINVGNPIALYEYEDKLEALTKLRDEMATLLYECFELAAPRVKRKDLGQDPRMDYLEERKNEYFETKWTKDVFDEEIVQYLDGYEKERKSIIDDLENVEVTKDNANVMIPIKQRILEYRKYDLKDYMHRTWKDK